MKKHISTKTKPNKYLKIIDIKHIDDKKVVDEKKATHVVEVDESDYADTVEMFNKYLPKIKLHFPMDPAIMRALEEQG